MTGRSLVRPISLLLTMTMLAMGISLVSSTPSSAATVAPRTSSYEDHGPDFLSRDGGFIRYSSGKYAGHWIKLDTKCGIWGCSGIDHYFTSKKGATAWWYLDDVQGEFQLEFLNPEGENEGLRKMATAHISVEVREKRQGKSNWSTIKYYTIDQSRWNDQGGWAPWPSVHLDGEVFIKAEVLSGYAGVSNVKLTYKGLHSRHKNQAEVLCFDNRLASLQIDSVVWSALDWLTPSIPGMNDPISLTTTFIEYVATTAGRPIVALTLVNTIDSLDDTFSTLAESYGGSGLQARIRAIAEYCDALPPDYKYLGSLIKKRIARKTQEAYIENWQNRQWCREYGRRLFDFSAKGEVCFDRAN